MKNKILKNKILKCRNLWYLCGSFRSPNPRKTKQNFFSISRPMILNTRFSHSEKMFTYLELGLVRIPSILYPDWLISKHTKSRQKMLCFIGL